MFSLVSAFLGVWYIIFTYSLGLITLAIVLIGIAYTLLLIAFIVPATVNAIPPLWAVLYYSQFEEAQSDDLKAVSSEEEDSEE